MGESAEISETKDGSDSRHGISEKEKTENEKTREQEKELLYATKVMGPSGEAYDCVGTQFRLPMVQVGDLLSFANMGAYTCSLRARMQDPILKCYLSTDEIEIIEKE